MLVLKRKAGENLLIGDNIEIKIVEIDDGKVKIGIDAPKEITILRKEVLDEAKAENKAAVGGHNKVDKSELKKMLKK